MTIAAGTRLGPYEILSPAGAGGMGEVWKARDTRLGRSVAIKLLPAEFAKNAHLRMRLEREARAISQLNHPSICTLHDIGDTGDVLYLVMEYVEGESLADRLERGALPLAEVVRYGAQIAEGLDRAHRAGIVHRDLKPGNVMITRAGVKLLDFGLAKSAGDAPSAALLAHDAPTFVQRPLTAEGTVVGTLQYMSPEQLSGETIDHRTDLFALGAVLYEMACGKRPFTGNSRTAIVAAILGTDPLPLQQVQPLTPPSFEHVVLKCLEKDREQRWQSAFDVAEELRWIGQQPLSGATPAMQRPRSRVPMATLWAIAVLAIVIAGWAAWRLRDMQPRRVRKTVVSTDIDNAWNVSPVISPDGRYVAYPAQHALSIRSLDEVEPMKVPIVGEMQPLLFWSPDSKWVAYASEGKLLKITPGSTSPVVIAPLPANVDRFHSGAWGADDRIVVAEYKGGLYEVSARGGTMAQIVDRDTALVDFHNLLFLPDGKTLLAVPHNLTSMSTIEQIDGTKRRTILTFQEGTVRGIAYSSSGHLLVSLGGVNAGLWAVPFSTKNVAPSGKQFLVAAGAGGCTASSDGSLVYVANLDLTPTRMVRLDRTGKIIESIGEQGARMQTPLFSPDETLIAVAARRPDNSEGIDVIDRATGGVRRLSTSVDARVLSWSPDGKQLLAYRSFGLNWNDPRFGLWLLSVDGTAEPRRFVNGSGGTFTPDGRIAYVPFAVRNSDDSADLNVVPIDGGTPVVVKHFAGASTTAISPDGRFLAYSDRIENSEAVFVTRFPNGGETWRVSAAGGSHPSWSADSRTIYFTAGNRLFNASFRETPAVSVSAPVLMFDGSPQNVDLDGLNYSVLRDGSVIAIQTLPPTKRAVILAQNWAEEFR